MSSRKADWYKRFGNARPPHVATLPSDFAGVKAGSTLLISSPAEIATYLSAIPSGETRTVARLRSDLARKAGADAMCPVTTAIFLRIVAEVSIGDMQAGKSMEEVVPFWRVVTPDSKIAAKLSCGPDGVAWYAERERSVTGGT